MSPHVPTPHPAVDVATLPRYRVLVCFPSGQEFPLTGAWLGPTTLKGSIASVTMFVGEETPDHPAPGMALDPRGLYLDLDAHAVLYNPRQYWPKQPGWVKQFLRAHPTWPARRLARWTNAPAPSDARSTP